MADETDATARLRVYHDRSWDSRIRVGDIALVIVSVCLIVLIIVILLTVPYVVPSSIAGVYKYECHKDSVMNTTVCT
jgi:hypothetical protein